MSLRLVNQWKERTLNPKNHLLSEDLYLFFQLEWTRSKLMHNETRSSKDSMPLDKVVKQLQKPTNSSVSNGGTEATVGPQRAVNDDNVYSLNGGN